MLEMEDRRISKELHSDEQCADRKLSFTAAIYCNNCMRHQQHKAAASAPRLVVELGQAHGTKEENRSKYFKFKCIDLPSDLMYLTV